MTETQRTPEGMSSKPRIKPADAEDGRPVSISARLGRLQFHYSGKFRVLQIADIQDGPKVSKDTIALIEAGKVNPKDFYSHVLPYEKIDEAVKLTLSKQALKVILDFDA